MINQFEDKLFLFYILPLIFSYSLRIIVRGSAYVYYVTYDGFTARGFGILFLFLSLLIFMDVIHGFVEAMDRNYKKFDFAKLFIKSPFMYSLLALSLFTILSVIYGLTYKYYLCVYILLLAITHLMQLRFVKQMRKVIANN